MTKLLFNFILCYSFCFNLFEHGTVSPCCLGHAVPACMAAPGPGWRWMLLALAAWSRLHGCLQRWDGPPPAVAWPPLPHQEGAQPLLRASQQLVLPGTEKAFSSSSQKNPFHGWVPPSSPKIKPWKTTTLNHSPSSYPSFVCSLLALYPSYIEAPKTAHSTRGEAMPMHARAEQSPLLTIWGCCAWCIPGPGWPFWLPGHTVASCSTCH